MIFSDGLKLTKKYRLRNCFIKGYSSGLGFVSTIHRNAIIRTSSGSIFDKSSVVAEVFSKRYQVPSHHYLSTSLQQAKIPWEDSSHAALLRKLDIALKDHEIKEAWESFADFKRLYGFPKDYVLSRLITVLSYSSDPHWLQKACGLVHLISKQKPSLLQPDLLTKLSLSLARSQMVIPASMILRLMLEMKNLPSMDLLQLVILYMVKTEIGTNLGSNFLVQICEKRIDQEKLTKPDTMIFNLVLDACVRFKLSFKGHLIVELMAKTGVIADAHTIIFISQIHEMNGQRDEMKRLKPHIDNVSASCVSHYQYFYDCLFSLHFKFNDIDSAAEVVLDICRSRKPLPHLSQKPFLVPIGSHNLKDVLKVQIMPEQLHKDSVFKMEGINKQELVIFRSGKLVLSNKGLAKLINGYRHLGKITELSKLLLHIQKELASLEGSNLCSTVVNACIQLGWLETAHDILDDLESKEAQMGPTSYMSLLKAYYEGNMLREANALQKQMNRGGIFSEPSDEYEKKETSMLKSGLAESLVQEMKEKSMILPQLFELNSSVYFFCKAKMMGDALNTYRRMQEMRIKPIEQIFINLACGYASLGMYRSITFLWGDMKRNMESGDLIVSRDFYEFLLVSFIRGGYFERVMEVMEYMKKNDMFLDKLMYKSEFLKRHRDLYRSLKVSETRTEAQAKRLEFVRAFRKWAGID